MAIPDTFECRFEIMCLHVFFVMERLSQGDEFLCSVATELVQEIFSGLEIGLREQGIGDFGVGPKMNRFSRNFWGRMRAYEAAADLGDFKDPLWKNLFSRSATEEGLKKMNNYCKAQLSYAKSLSQDEIRKGSNPFTWKNA